MDVSEIFPLVSGLAEFLVEIMGLRLATGFGGLKPTHSLAPVTAYKSGM